MFHKDTFRLIRKTFNRFFSLLMIVLIGSSFMMGLLSSRPIMEQSVDRYNDDRKLQDFQIYSSYGFDDNDIRALRKQDFVEDLFASKMVDVFSENEYGDVLVTRVEEVNRPMNDFQLISGRLPERSDELVIVSNSIGDSSHLLGSKLRLYLDDEDLGEKLVNTEYEIVGMAKTPCYMAKIQGTSNLKNLELDLIVYIPNNNFKAEYYTTVYFTVPEAMDLQSYDDEYHDFIEEKGDEVKIFALNQQDNLKETLLAEYREKIAEGEKELEEKKAEGQAKLDEAKQKLDDAKIQIIAAQTQLDTMRTAISTGTARISALQRQYDNDYAAIDKRIKDVESKDAQGRSFQTIFAETLSDYATYNALKNIKNSQSISPYAENITRIENENAEYRNRLNGDLYPQRNELNEIINSPSATAEEKQIASDQLIEVNRQITELETQITVNELLIENLKDMDDQSGTGNVDELIANLDRKYGGSIESVYISQTSLSQDLLRLEATREEIRIANEAIARINLEIEGAEAEIASGQIEYEAGEKEYREGVILFNEEIEKAEAEIRKAYQDLEELPDAKWMVLDRDSHYSSYMFASNASQMGAIGTYMPILFYLVAALVCMTTMTRLVDEQRGQIGIFRALGFSKWEVTSKYLIYALLASLIGCVLGIVFGMMVFPTVIYQTWRLMYDLPDMMMLFPIENIAICVVAFTGLMLLVTYFVVRKTLNEEPSQLLRPKAPKNARKTFIENITFIWRRLSFTSKITARNLIRYKSRFFMTVIGVAGCTGLLVVGWGIKDSIADVVAIQFGQIYNHDYVINLENDHNIEEINTILENDLNNEYFAGIMTYSSKVYLDDKEKVITMEVLDARSGNDVFNLRETDCKTPLKMNNTGVIVSQKFAKVNGIKAGDQITIESSTGLKAKVKVNEICEMYFQHYIYISNEYYETVFREPVHYNCIAVKTNDGETLRQSLEGVEGVESMVDFSTVTKQFNTMIEALNYIILVIIVTAGSLAFVVLINLTQVNISERIREIATLKVLGFRNHEINSYIFKEIMLLSVIGGVIGLPLGVLEHHFIMGVIDMEMIRFGTNIKLMSFIYAYVITIVFTLIVLMFTRKPLRKIEMIESLKSVE